MKPTLKKSLSPSRTQIRNVREAEEPVQEKQLAISQPIQTDENGVEGELNRSDITTPSLKIVQAIGPLSEHFEGGVVVLNGEIPICDEPDKNNPTPLRLTVIRIKKQYEENLEHGGENRPRVFKSENDVIAAGGHCNWVNNRKPPFSPIATMLVAVKAPDTNDETILANFPHVFNSKTKECKHLNGAYALALYKTKGSSYTRVAKLVFNAALMSDLKAKGLVYGDWAFGSKREKINNNFVFVPVMKRVGTHPDEFVEFLQHISSM